MTVYEFIHMTYCWEDNDYDLCDSEVFATYADAFTYFKCVMDRIIDEYIQETHAEIGTIEEFEEYEYAYYYENGIKEQEPLDDKKYCWPYMHISLDEYGSDMIVVRKKNVLSFV